MPLATFPDVTLLITHYNRSSSLERLLVAFAGLGMAFGAVVVADDCSRAPHQEHLLRLQQRYAFRLVTSPVNRGLGHNLNQGQDAVATPYTLYVQEDFVPTAQFAREFGPAARLLAEAPALDLVRFYAYYAYPYLTPYAGKFAEMQYRPWYLNYTKIYNYSDHPHLRRSTFFDKFGRYREGIKSDRTEYLMCVSFIQNHGKGLFYTDFDQLFTQENSAAEPSTVARSAWRHGNHAALALVRTLYRQLKYNFDIHLGKRVRS